MASVSSVSSVSSPASVSTLSSRNDDQSDNSDELQQILIRRRRHRRRPRIFRIRGNPFESYNEEEFKSRFRLSKNSVRFVLNLIENRIRPLTDRNKSICAMNQLLIALRFYACGSFQIVIGDHFGVTKATVSRIVHKVSDAVARLSRVFIKMPRSLREKRETCADFFNLARFPNVIGVIDGSHIRLQSPGGNAAETFRNRKGYFSLNIQCVCNARLQINDVVARWPGSSHDSHIFDNSLVRARLENNEFEEMYLLGDSGYPCRRYVLTPINNPETEAERRYNFAHIKTRNAIERTFGVLKRRFPCLSLGLRVSIDKACAIIIATCVLHNICIKMLDNMVADEVDGQQPQPNDPDLNNIPRIADGNNFAVRNAVIHTIFE